MVFEDLRTFEEKPIEPVPQLCRKVDQWEIVVVKGFAAVEFRCSTGGLHQKYLTIFSASLSEQSQWTFVLTASSCDSGQSIFKHAVNEVSLTLACETA